MNENVLRLRFIVAICCAVGGAGLFTSGSSAAEPAEIRASRVIECGIDDAERAAVVTGVSISADGRLIAAATDDHCVRTWDRASATAGTRVDTHSDWVRAVAISDDGSTLASGACDRLLCLSSVDRSQQHQLPACTSAISGVCFHPNDQQVAVVGFSDSVKIVNTSTGQVSQELVCPCGDVRSVAFSADGERMAAAGRNGKIRVWNTTSGARQQDIETDGRRIRALAFSPDGRWLAAAGNSPEVRILDATSGEEVMTLNTRPAKVFAMVFVANRRLATGGTDNRIHIWDLDTRQKTASLVGHTGTVTALDCDRRGAVLVSGSYDTTVRVWELAGEELPATASRKPAAKR